MRVLPVGAGALAQALVEEMASTGEQPPPERSEGWLPGEGVDDTGAADAAVRQVLAELEAATLALLKAPLGVRTVCYLGMQCYGMSNEWD